MATKKKPNKGLEEFLKRVKINPFGSAQQIGQKIGTAIQRWVKQSNKTPAQIKKEIARVQPKITILPQPKIKKIFVGGTNMGLEQRIRSQQRIRAQRAANRARATAQQWERRDWQREEREFKKITKGSAFSEARNKTDNFELFLEDRRNNRRGIRKNPRTGRKRASLKVLQETRRQREAERARVKSLSGPERLAEKIRDYIGYLFKFAEEQIYSEEFFAMLRNPTTGEIDIEGARLQDLLPLLTPDMQLDLAEYVGMSIQDLQSFIELM